MENIIEIIGLRKKLGHQQVLHNVQLHVQQGDIYGFLGPNGAGKSTTIRCLLSLITPDEGSVRIFGKSLATHRHEILRQIGCIVERPDLYLELSALRNLQVSSLMYGLSTTTAYRQQLLEQVGLADVGSKKVGAFSQGMKQRLALAQALLHNPPLIILDEPASGLDPQGILDFRLMLQRLRNEAQKTIFLSSHDLSEVEQVATRMVILHKGKTLVEGAVQDLLSDNDLVVALETVQPLAATQWQGTAWAAHLQQGSSGTQWQFRLRKNQLPLLQQYLQEQNIAIYSLYYKKSLEDYFLQLTTEHA